jgi:mannosylglycerate hydrolase
MAAAGPVIINPSARTRSGIVELTVPGDPAIVTIEGAQLVAAVPAGTRELAGVGADLALVIGQLSEEGWLVGGGGGGALELDAGDDGVQLTIRVGRGQRARQDAQAVMAEAWAQAGASPDRPLKVRVEREGWQRVAVHVRDLPGFGWASWSPGPLAVPPVIVSEAGLDNGLVHVLVDRDEGTWSLGDLTGLDRLVDEGDEGDTYNFSPPPGDLVVDRPVLVSVAVLEAGPVRGGLRVTRTFQWPERLEDGKRTGQVDVAVVTDLELRAGEDLVRVTTSLDNRCRDHRLRTVFPLPAAATVSWAESAFGIVERGLTAEGGPLEYGLATFPARRFVSAGGLTVLHDGLLEYELVDDGQALAVTLLRATGMLSRDHMTYRPNPAGPPLAVEGPQLQGRVEVRYAVHAGEVDPYVLADQAWLPLEVTRGGGGGDRLDRGSLLTVTGAEVSALRQVGGSLELRVFNPTDEEATVRVEGRSGWLIDLRGLPIEPFDGDFPLRPWGIATARLAP